MDKPSVPRSAVLGALAIATLLLLPDTSAACRCTPVAKDPDIALRHTLASADVVISGTVRTVTPTTLPNLGEGVNVNDAPYLPGTSGVVAAIGIERLWKGNVDTSTIDLFIGSTLCDIQLEPGDNRLLFVFGPDVYGYYTTNHCVMSFAAGSNDEQLVDSLDAIDAEEIDAWRGDFITYGCGGGIAASYSDVTIYRDGRITRDSISHVRDGKRETLDFQPDAKLADRIFGSIDYDELDRIDGVFEPAPRSCSLRAQILGRGYSATWGASQFQPSDRLLEQLKPLKSVPVGNESE